MHAYAIARHDHFSGLERTEVPLPRPTAGQVTIDVRTAGLGLIDALWVSGAMPSDLGFIPGIEASGRVREIGVGVTGLVPGQPVAAFLPGGGGLAQVALAPASLVAPVPSGLDIDVAGVVPVNSVTAHLALTALVRLTPGESLLIHAGVGGLGSQFAAVAREIGARRIDAVVGSPAKRDRARELGYDHAFLRTELETIPGGAYDVVIDPVGGEATRSGFAALRDGGRLVRVGNASQAPDVPLSSIAHWLENKSTIGFNVGAWLGAHPEAGSASLRWVLEAAARGAIRVDLTRLETPERVSELLADLAGGRTTGKVAVRMV